MKEHPNLIDDNFISSISEQMNLEGKIIFKANVINAIIFVAILLIIMGNAAKLSYFGITLELKEPILLVLLVLGSGIGLFGAIKEIRKDKLQVILSVWSRQKVKDRYWPIFFEQFGEPNIELWNISKREALKTRLTNPNIRLYNLKIILVLAALVLAMSIICFLVIQVYVLVIVIRSVSIALFVGISVCVYVIVMDVLALFLISDYWYPLKHTRYLYISNENTPL
jgi:hypothetical protein